MLPLLCLKNCIISTKVIRQIIRFNGVLRKYAGHTLPHYRKGVGECVVIVKYLDFI